MKIFNWVHRRFIHKDGFGENVKKGDDEILTKDGDTQALLENVVFADMLDHGWRGGILAIGTFGLDSTKDFINEVKEHRYQCMVKDEEEFGDEYLVEGEIDSINDEEEEEELNPLMCLASNYNNDGLEGSNGYGAAPTANAGIVAIDGKSLTQRADHGIDSDSNEWEYGNKMNKKERITLADLFSAESDGNPKPNYCKKHHQQFSKKPTKPTPPDHAAKPGQSFPKKLIKEDSRPVRKLNQLMKRMLKRKIHPHVVEGKNIHKESWIKPDDVGANESVSLLQINQDTRRGL